MSGTPIIRGLKVCRTRDLVCDSTSKYAMVGDHKIYKHSHSTWERINLEKNEVLLFQDENTEKLYLIQARKCEIPPICNCPVPVPETPSCIVAPNGSALACATNDGNIDVLATNNFRVRPLTLSPPDNEPMLDYKADTGSLIVGQQIPATNIALVGPNTLTVGTNAIARGPNSIAVGDNASTGDVADSAGAFGRGVGLGFHSADAPASFVFGTNDLSAPFPRYTADTAVQSMVAIGEDAYAHVKSSFVQGSGLTDILGGHQIERVPITTKNISNNISTLGVHGLGQGELIQFPVHDNIDVSANITLSVIGSIPVISQDILSDDVITSLPRIDVVFEMSRTQSVYDNFRIKTYSVTIGTSIIPVIRLSTFPQIQGLNIINLVSIFGGIGGFVININNSILNIEPQEYIGFADIHYRINPSV